MKKLLFLLAIALAITTVDAQQLIWSPDGNSYALFEEGGIYQYEVKTGVRKALLTKEQLTPSGGVTLEVDHYSFSTDQSKILLFANTQRVWRLNTRGDYWVFDTTTGRLRQIGATLPATSLMFAKFSPDGNHVAYVSNYNIYVEDLTTGKSKALTTDGDRHFIYGTFDWVYEEEFSCRDGFRWSPDSKSIAFWHIDARRTRDFLMINTTDSIYSFNVPVEYPKVGEDPSACKVGTVNIATGKIEWLPVPGDSRQHYIVRMEYLPGTSDLLLQQLNRKQNHSKIMRVKPGQQPELISEEQDRAWVDLVDFGNAYSVDYTHKFIWMDGGKSFLWVSDRDGWRHLYKISSDGKQVRPITPEPFDIIELSAVDTKSGYAYFLASPDNATQKYLYRKRLTGKGTLERITPMGMAGTHGYEISPNARFARHAFSNTYTAPVSEFVSLPGHEPINKEKSIASQLPKAQKENITEFFKVTLKDGTSLDGWMVKPENFDATKKYPVVFYVYTEPASQTVVDRYNASRNRLYVGDMRKDGYVYISVDGRGTPAPKGNAWRKSIYRKIGRVNINDQAEAARQILEWSFIDKERVAVWGWSGGGSATLNLLFQYPEIYKTGIAIAAVANQLTYDNIYQERYMGLPQENREDFIKGSPITFAKNLKGNLLYIHGTGDDNVHYQNAEMLINELVKHNKQFQFMAYPNRSHGIREGEGTSLHLATLYTNYLRQYCPPGGR